MNAMDMETHDDCSTKTKKDLQQWVQHEHSSNNHRKESEEVQEALTQGETEETVSSQTSTTTTASKDAVGNITPANSSSSWGSWTMLNRNRNSSKTRHNGETMEPQDLIELSKVTRTTAGAVLFQRHRKRKKGTRKKHKKDDQGNIATREKEQGSSVQKLKLGNMDDDSEEEDRPGYHPLQADIESSEASIWVILAAIRNAQRILGPFSLVETAAWLWYCLQYGAPVIPKKLREKLDYDEEFLGLTYPQYPKENESGIECGGDVMTSKRYESSQFKRIKPPVATSVASELHHWALFAAAGYASDSVEFARRARIPPTDVVACNFQSTHCRPAYVICIDRQAEAIVIVIRGTRTQYDVLTDLAGADVEFGVEIPDLEKSQRGSYESKSTTDPTNPLDSMCQTYTRPKVQQWLRDGKVHEGFLYCANVLLGRSPVVDQESGKVLSLSKFERESRKRKLAQQESKKRSSDGKSTLSTGKDSNRNEGKAERKTKKETTNDTWSQTYGSNNRNIFARSGTENSVDEGSGESSDDCQDSDWDELQREELQSLGGIGAIALEYLAEFPEYRLIVTGHSLGGGVASLLAMKLLLSSNVKFAKEAHDKCATKSFTDASKEREHDSRRWLFQSYPLHCFCYGVPPACGEELGKLFEPYITSVVLGDDMVPRLSLHSVAAVRAAARMSRTVWVEDLKSQILRHPVGQAGFRVLEYVDAGWEACRDVASLVLGKLWDQLGEYVWRHSDQPGNSYRLFANETRHGVTRKDTMIDWLYRWLPRGSHAIRRSSETQSAPPLSGDDASVDSLAERSSECSSGSDTEELEDESWVYLTEGMAKDMSLELEQMKHQDVFRKHNGVEHSSKPYVGGGRGELPREIGTAGSPYSSNEFRGTHTVLQSQEYGECSPPSTQASKNNNDCAAAKEQNENLISQETSQKLEDSSKQSVALLPPPPENPEDDIPPQTLFVPGTIFHIAPWDARLFRYGFGMSHCQRRALSMLVVSPYMRAHHRRRLYVNSLQWLTNPDNES